MNELVERERSVEAYVRELPMLVFPETLNRAEYFVVPRKRCLIAAEQSGQAEAGKAIEVARRRLRNGER